MAGLIQINRSRISRTRLVYGFAFADTGRRFVARLTLAAAQQANSDRLGRFVQPTDAVAVEYEAPEGGQVQVPDELPRYVEPVLRAVAFEAEAVKPSVGRVPHQTARAFPMKQIMNCRDLLVQGWFLSAGVSGCSVPAVPLRASPMLCALHVKRAAPGLVADDVRSKGGDPGAATGGMA